MLSLHDKMDNWLIGLPPSSYQCIDCGYGICTHVNNQEFEFECITSGKVILPTDLACRKFKLILSLTGYEEFIVNRKNFQRPPQ
jgi:hypothetical protein